MFYVHVWTDKPPLLLNHLLQEWPPSVNELGYYVLQGTCGTSYQTLF